MITNCSLTLAKGLLGYALFKIIEYWSMFKLFQNLVMIFIFVENLKLKALWYLYSRYVVFNSKE